MTYYRQCILIKDRTTQTAWIPEKYAKRGKYIKIKEDDGWLVVTVGERAAEEQVFERSQDYKRTRKASDI